MQMFALHGKVNEPEAEPLARQSERGSHTSKEPVPPERRHAPHDTQGDVDRMMP